MPHPPPTTAEDFALHLAALMTRLAETWTTPELLAVAAALHREIERRAPRETGTTPAG